MVPQEFVKNNKNAYPWPKKIVQLLKKRMVTCLGPGKGAGSLLNHSSTRNIIQNSTQHAMTVPKKQENAHYRRAFSQSTIAFAMT